MKLHPQWVCAPCLMFLACWNLVLHRDLASIRAIQQQQVGDLLQADPTRSHPLSEMKAELAGLRVEMKERRLMSATTQQPEIANELADLKKAHEAELGDLRKAHEESAAQTNRHLQELYTLINENHAERKLGGGAVDEAGVEPVIDVQVRGTTYFSRTGIHPTPTTSSLPRSTMPSFAWARAMLPLRSCTLPELST
jgi:hypothetical protein